jgi:hypothetical protein
VRDERLQQHGRSEVVGRGVLGDLVHALADADVRGEVIDGVDAVQRAADGRLVPDVAAYELDGRVEVPRTAGIGAVHLRGQVVERAHAMALAQEFVGQVRSDEPCAARDEYVHDRSARKWRPRRAARCGRKCKRAATAARQEIQLARKKYLPSEAHALIVARHRARHAVAARLLTANSANGVAEHVTRSAASY